MESFDERAKQVASQTSLLISRIVFSVLILSIFIGLAFLTYVGQLQGEAVTLFSGVVLGYLARGLRERL